MAPRFSHCAKGNLLLATGSMDGTVQIWDAKSMELRCTVKEPRAMRCKQETG